MRALLNSCKKQIQRAVPLTQSVITNNVRNAKACASHFPALSAPLIGFRFDGFRVRILNGSGYTPRKDLCDAKRERRIMRRGACKYTKSADFINTHRLNIVTAISTTGDIRTLVSFSCSSICPITH